MDALIPNPDPAVVTVVPLGGIGEIGKNMTAYHFQGSIIIADCGLKFPDDELLGVDLVIPDFSWLRDRAEMVKGVFLTHGHEDHIGSLPYFLADINVPVWGTPLTIGFVRRRLEEHKLDALAQLNEVEAGDRIQAGPFEVEYVRVSHSIPDACSLAIRTEVGTIFHTSDFKFDSMPVDGRTTDVARLAQIGAEGVLAMLTDSTNVERPGYSRSESELLKTFDRIFSETTGRVIVACFASNIHRVQQIADVSIKHGRRMAVIGRSMEQNVDTALKLGYLQIPNWALIDFGDVNGADPSTVTVMTTGSQGEPLSVLSRLANDSHKKLSIREGDTVIISAKPIPGNESLVHRVINNLFRRGANVIYSDIEPVHVSGHAYREEMRLMMSFIKPKFLVPVHGEHRHLAKFVEMAGESGYSRGNVMLLDEGEVLELTSNNVRKAGKLDQIGAVMVDGIGIGDVGDISIRDRWQLANAGILIVVVSIDQHTGEVVAGPDILLRGVTDEQEDFVADARAAVEEALSELTPHAAADPSSVRQVIKEELSWFESLRTRRKPVIIPIVMQV